MASSVSFFAVRTPGLDLGLDASRVLRVLSGTDWDGPGAVDVVSLLEATPSIENLRRVLVLSGPLGTCAVSTDRELCLRTCPDKDLFPLPDLLWSAPTQPLLTSVAMLPDQPPLIVLSVDGLCARLSQRGARVPPGDDP